MRALLALAILAVLALTPAASILTVNVSGLSDTALVGTKIEILKNSVVILNDTADKFGVANFDVTDGYYIVRTTRGFYPVKVQVAKVEGNSVAKLRMDLDSNTATLYGTVSYGKHGLDGMKLYATQKGVTIKDARIYPEGVYVLTFLDEGTYDIVFSKGEWEPLNLAVSLAARETKLLDIGLSKKSEGGIVSLSVPKTTSLYGTIVAKLMRGERPMNASEISVLTPDGITKITSDENGEAKINAAKPGNYTFTYANVTSSTSVEAPLGSAPAGQQKPATVKKPVEIAPKSGPAAEQKLSENTLFFIVGIAMVGCGVLLAGAVAFIMLRKQHAHEETLAHATHGMGNAPHSEHAQMHSERMYEHERHMHPKDRAALHKRKATSKK